MLLSAIQQIQHPPKLRSAALSKSQANRGTLCGLRAALSLAKLYQSTGRDAEAHAVLAPALEGFSATPEMPRLPRARRC